MGLEGVELAIAIEEEFGIVIPDSIGANMRTVGDVYNWVLAQVEDTPPTVCLSQKVFYKLRSALVANYSVNRNDIHPDARIIDLLPPKELLDGWCYLRLFTDLRTPERLRAEFTHIRSIVNAIVELNSNRFLLEEKNNPDEVWNRLVAVFCKQLYVEPSDIHPRARLVQDLGLG